MVDFRRPGHICAWIMYVSLIFIQLDETASLTGLEKAINYFEVCYVCVFLSLSVVALDNNGIT